MLFADQFGNDAVLGRAEEGRLGCSEEENGEHPIDVRGAQGEQREDHGEYFDGFGEEDDGALFEAVGELAGVGGEDQERGDEDEAGEFQIIAAVGLANEGHGEERDNNLIHVVVKGVEELQPQEGLDAGEFQDFAVTTLGVHTALDGKPLATVQRSALSAS